MQNPLGPYGNLVAAALALLTVAAALVTHVIPGLAPDPFLDNMALLALGVVFGTQVVQNGTQAKAATALARVAALEATVAAIHTTSQLASPESAADALAAIHTTAAAVVPPITPASQDPMP